MWQGPHSLEIVEKDVPKPEPGFALVRVEACGICGSDIHGYTGESGRRTPGMIMGHEFAGTVTEVNGEARDVAVGQRVAVNPLWGCGKCFYCLRGDPQICPNRLTIGVNITESGAFSEYVTVPVSNLVPIADHVSFEEASMAEPLAVALRGFHLSGLSQNDVTLICGAGTIGLCALLVCKAHGLETVFITDKLLHRLEVAEKIGGISVAPEDNPAERVLSCTSGLGAKATLDAVGIGATITQSLMATMRGGKVVLIGLATPKVDIALYELVPQERLIQGSYAYTPDEYRQAVQLIEDGIVDVKPLIEKVVPLSQAPESFAALASGGDKSVKVVVKP